MALSYQAHQSVYFSPYRKKPNPISDHRPFEIGSYTCVQSHQYQSPYPATTSSSSLLEHVSTVPPATLNLAIVPHRHDVSIRNSRSDNQAQNQAAAIVSSPESKQATTFTLFPQLPKELRLQIWEIAATQGRLIRCTWDPELYEYTIPHYDRIPAMLHISKEAREVALPMQKLVFTRSEKIGTVCLTNEEIFVVRWGFFMAFPYGMYAIDFLKGRYEVV